MNIGIPAGIRSDHRYFLFFISNLTYHAVLKATYTIAKKFGYVYKMCVCVCVFFHVISPKITAAFSGQTSREFRGKLLITPTFTFDDTRIGPPLLMFEFFLGPLEFWFTFQIDYGFPRNFNRKHIFYKHTQTF